MSRHVVFNEKCFPYTELAAPPVSSSNASDYVLTIDPFPIIPPNPILTPPQILPHITPQIQTLSPAPLSHPLTTVPHHTPTLPPSTLEP